MALADILKALQRDGEAEVALITAERDETVSAIGSDARHRAKEARETAATSRDAALALEAEVIRHRAELHVQRRLQEAREVIFQEILGRAKDRLSRHRRDPAYPDTVEALVVECFAFLDEAEVVAVDPRDADLVKAALQRHNISVRVETSLETWGGLVVTDGRGVFVRNTIEERLARAELELRRRIGDLVPGLRGGEELRAAS